ncbi:MAG: hypothetical protein ACI8P0_002692, partial [Planctomycetaceae bacterium]
MLLSQCLEMRAASAYLKKSITESKKLFDLGAGS